MNDGKGFFEPGSVPSSKRYIHCETCIVNSRNTGARRYFSKGLAFDVPASPILTTMHYQFVFGQLFVAQILAILARADYTMDDGNVTITYNGYWDRHNGDTDTQGLNNSLLFYSTV